MEQVANTIDSKLPGERTARTGEIVRGVLRLFRRLDSAALPEVVLGNGRRADVLAIDRRGRLTIVEVKSSREDFRADTKWTAYLDYCDGFAFAVDTDFPQELLPADSGIIVADAHGAAFVRSVPPGKGLLPARRRALMLCFARTAAGRLARFVDPLDTAVSARPRDF